jgi:hypothetical protein
VTQIPTLLLPAALVEPPWADAARLADLAALPGWTAVARRARVLAQAGPEGPPPSEPGHERWLRTRFGLDADRAVAACSALADGRERVDWRLDPVHLHVGRDHLVLTDPAALALSPDDAQALAGSVAALFADEGLALDAYAGARWYLRELDPARPLRLRTHSMLGALGRNIDAWMPVGDDARRWRRLVNEVQMTWYAHPVNARREAQGLPPVNSLWIEGRGPGTGPALAPAAAHALARIAAHRAGPAPDAVIGAPGTALANAASPLVVVDDAGPLSYEPRLLDAHVAGDPQGWAQAWRALDATVFTPIGRAEGPWRDGANLVLAGDAGWRALRIAPRADWRFWRRPKGAALLAEPVPARGGPDAEP